MAKKKGGKGKGKEKKGKDADTKKGKLSHHEREIFLLTIEELQHKIECRNHLSDILEEDLKQYREAIDLDTEDREQGVRLLEEAIREQIQATEKIERAIPDAENSKLQAEERRARELAEKLVQANLEKVSYDSQLQVLRKKLKSLEAYSPEKVDEKIKEVEKQLHTEDEDAFLKGRELDRRRVEAFRKEMQEILKQEAESFQDEISGKLDKNFERITEETRWWKDMVRGLEIDADRLESLNEVRSHELSKLQENLRQRKEASVQASLRLQEKKALASELRRRDEEREAEEMAELQYRRQLDKLRSIAEGLRKDVDLQRHMWMESFSEIERTEAEIEALEDKLAAEIRFGCELDRFIERAVELLSEEVKHPLVVTYDGPPEEGKTLLKLRSLFGEATKFIYERENSTVL